MGFFSFLGSKNANNNTVEIKYTLACTNCVSTTPSYIDIITNAPKLVAPTREQLIKMRGGFDDFRCEQCGAISKVLVKSIDITPSMYRKQMFMEVSQKGKNLGSHVDGGYTQFSKGELRAAFLAIAAKSQEMANQIGRTHFDVVAPEKGWMLIVVDFLVDNSQPKVSLMHTTNMTYRPVAGLMNYLMTTVAA